MRDNGALLASSVADDATGANGTIPAPASPQDTSLEQPTRDPGGEKGAANDEAEPAATPPTESANEDSHPEGQAHHGDGCDDQNGTLEARGIESDESPGNDGLSENPQASSRHPFPDAVTTLREMVGNLDSILKLSLDTKEPMHLLRTSCSLVTSISEEIDMLLESDGNSSTDHDERNPRPWRRRRAHTESERLTETSTISSDNDKVKSEVSEMGSNSPIGLDDFLKSAMEQRLKVAHIWARIFVSPLVNRFNEDIIAVYDDEGPAFSLRQLPTEYPRPNEGADSGPQRLPTVLQIKSIFLLLELNNILGVDLKKDHDGLIVAPFSAIVYCWGQILAKIKQDREANKARKAALRERETEPSDDSDKTEEPHSQHSTPKGANSIAALHRRSPGLAFGLITPSVLRRRSLDYMIRKDVILEGMADLLRYLIGPTLEVREKLENSTLETISFEDLWQLFPVGEILIYQKDGCEVACQVYNTVGGRRGRAGSNAPYINDLFSAPEDIVNQSKAEDSRPRDRGIPRYPGSLIHHIAGPHQAKSSNEEEVSKTREFFLPVIIDCFMMDFNGTCIGPCHISFQFDYFPGERPICALDAYPLRLHKDPDAVASRLKERGRRVIEAAGHRTHDGFSLSGLDNVRGQIYIDNATGYRHIGWPKERMAFGRLVQHMSRFDKDPRFPKAPIFGENFMIRKGYRLIETLKGTLWRFVRPESTTLSEDCYLLMSSVVLGYSFQMRRWYYFDIDRVGGIDKSETARLSGWKDLVIPTPFREILVALVDSHASGSSRAATRRKGPGLTSQIDLVRGKGNGLIILLHGPPGSGKTSTAETIAAYTRRPLYSITCGDIGTTAEEVEFNLQKHFDLANQWGCVLCLDEADVFLMKRDWHDLNRNSLVSVWLRILEYYSGILFITTNRIGVIDEAFKSRIHICLRYPSLDFASTTLIWTKILDRIERENEVEPVQIKFDRDAVMTFAQKHYQRNEATRSTWNGRQIRNVVQTAISLGHYERLKRLRDKDMTEEDAERAGKAKYMYVELTKDNLRRIATTATDFEQYIVNVRGSDANSARNESVRDDDYDDSGKRPQKEYGMLEVARVGGIASRGTPGRGSGFMGSEAWGMESECGYGQGNGKERKNVTMDDSDSSS